MLDPVDLSTFLAIAEYRHFGRAADALGIVQSVASKRLRRLEDQLGGRLIERTARSNIRLSRAGELFLDRARAALAAIETAEHDGSRIVRGRAGPLRVGYVFSAAMSGHLSGALGDLAQSLPDVEPSIELMETPAQIEAIADGRIDIGFVRPRPSYPEGVRAHIVHREPVVLAISTDHALAGTAEVEAMALAGSTFIVPQFHEEVGLVDIIRNLARQIDCRDPAIRRTGDFISAVTIAAAGGGIVLAPRSLANLRLPGIRYLPITGFSAWLDLVMIIHQRVPDEIVAALSARSRNADRA